MNQLGRHGKVIGETHTAQYTVGIVVGLLAIFIVIVVIVIAFKRKQSLTKPKSSPPIVAMKMPTLKMASDASLGSRGSASGRQDRFTPLSSQLASLTAIPNYDRNHVTGASSSSTSVTSSPLYPIETLNPPPSPVTDTSAAYRASQLSSTETPSVGSFSPSHGYGVVMPPPKRRQRAPPTTPCSTDVCDDSEPFLRRVRADDLSRRSRKPRARRYKDRSTRRSETRPLRAAEMHHAEQQYCSDGPTSDHSFFNPYPPPPSPVGNSARNSNC